VIALGVVINLALRRMLDRPLQKMARVVRRFGDGDMTVRMAFPGTAL